MKTTESITLGYCEGSSDKIYTASIGIVPGGYVVNFNYGRRGGTMNVGTKTSKPVSPAEAKRIYDKLVASKIAKGYTPTGTRSAFVKPVSAPIPSAPVALKVLPQLLNPIDDGELEAVMRSDNFWLQQKMDGKRILLHKDYSGRIYATNRTGLECGVPDNLLEIAATIPYSTFVLDGELVGDQYHVFDALHANGDLRSMAFGRRFAEMMNVVSQIPSRPDNCIHIVPLHHTDTEKRVAFSMLRRSNAEGVVFKNKTAQYSAGRPASGGDQLKYKFIETASVVVLGHNPGKRSVRMGLYGGTDIIEAGNVTIGGTISIPPIGSIIEVRYLYAFKESGALFQPSYIGERDDIDKTACHVSQLKYKQVSMAEMTI